MWDERSGATEPLLKKEDKGEFGKKYEHDPQFKGVTEEGRKCNDILFAVLFLLTCSAFVAISAVGFSNGDPEKLIPSDEYTTDVETKAEYWFQDAVVTVKRDADVMGGALALAIVLGMVWVQLMKMFTKIFIYLTLLIGIALVIAAGVYLFVVGGKPHNEGFRYASYAVFAIAALIVIAIVFLRSRIALTSALFKESCDGVQYNPSIFVVALILVGVFSLFVVYWTASFIYLFSIPSDSKVQIPHTPTKFDQTPRRLMFFQIFAFFWVTSFISAVFQVSVAGGIATWYFSRDVSSFGRTTGSPTFRSLGRAVTKSFGSLAFGSLILAVVKFINLMLRIAKKKAQVTNPVAKFLLGCLQCIFGVVQNLVKWINRYAYIYIAMHGDSFCSSSRNCFNLISRNFFYVAIVDLLGEIVLFVGKLLGTAACTIFTMGIVQALDRQLGYLSILMVAVIAFSVFTIFAHIIGVGVDTVLVCYLEDLERNKDGALYMPTELHKMLQEKVAKSHERIQ